VTGWSTYTLAMALFLSSHFVPRLFGLRTRLTKILGPQLYSSLYGLVSLMLLVWVIIAAANAPFIELWPQLPWMRWVPNIAMPLALMLAVCGLGIAQPYTLGGWHSRAFDPTVPGFAAISRHPLFLSLLLWAGAHVVPNGDLAHVLLFGIFALIPLAAIPTFDAMARRKLPPETGRTYFEATSVLSLAPLADPSWRRANGRKIGYRALWALLLWALLLALHSPIIGISPLPA